eukprot:9854490-Karenia_brevis.AAC.1
MNLSMDVGSPYTLMFDCRTITTSTTQKTTSSTHHTAKPILTRIWIPPVVASWTPRTRTQSKQSRQA